MFLLSLELGLNPDAPHPHACLSIFELPQTKPAQKEKKKKEADQKTEKERKACTEKKRTREGARKK